VTILLAFILSSSRHDGRVWAAIGACVGAYLFYRGFRMLARKRLIMNTPASKIRSASMGLVEVSGLAVGPYTMNAPITGESCFYYRTIAWQLKQSGKNTAWEKVADESLHVPFYLDDNTGRVLVDPQGAEMDLHRDFHDEFSGLFFSSSLDVPGNVAGFLARHGASLDKKTRIDEYCIKPKNFLFILGTLAENPGLPVTPTPVRSLTSGQHTVAFHIPGTVAGVSLSTGVTSTSEELFTAFKGDMAPEEIIRLSPDTKPANSSAMTQQGKIAAAMMRAGITNPAAWAAAGVQYPGVTVNPAGTSSATATAPAEEFDMNPKTVLMKGTHDPAFFVSWQSQRDVLRALGWKSTLMIWGGPALTLLCVYFLAAQFGWL
jgi:hypothetical protein